MKSRRRPQTKADNQRHQRPRLIDWKIYLGTSMSDVVNPHSYGIEAEEKDRIKERILTAFTRGATAGCILRGGLTAFVAVLSLFSGKKRSSNRHPLMEILRMTLFLGSLGGSYVLVDEIIAALWGKQRTSPWRGLAAGFCAGPTILLLGRRVRHNGLAIYILIRSLTLLVRCGNRQHRCRWLMLLLSPTRMQHGDALIMSATAAQIIYSYVTMPHTVPASYRHFLSRHTCRPRYVWDALSEMVSNEGCRMGKPVGNLEALKGTGHVPFHSSIPCRLLHPNRSCLENVLLTFPESYLRSLTVYLPVYLAPAVLVHRKRLLTESKVVFPKVLLGILRSSLFLTSVITLAYSGVCLVHNATGTTSQWTLLASLLLPGWAIIIEKKSRRMELALYALSRATESFVQCLAEWGYLKSIGTRMDVWIFSLSVAIITHCYSDDEGGHRHAFRSKYLNVLDFVFGNTGIHRGRIHHIPSNQDLIVMGSHWWTNGWIGRLMQKIWKQEESSP